ncbi:MAG: hypothetical protein KZQ58_00040 [gamma proteobacterium symbiont of Bathyaustriella thionipta]|nr:hypothetical protein [gamma proteobacterium symbiont of Bathyaustriella thionipta]
MPEETGAINLACLQHGCVDWQHRAWNADFYPHDLPPEWRLDYLANEVPLLAVSNSYRASSQPADLAEALQDCQDDLSVYFLLKADDPVYSQAQCSQWLAAAGKHLAGILLYAESQAAAAWIKQAGGKVKILQHQADYQQVQAIMSVFLSQSGEQACGLLTTCEPQDLRSIIALMKQLARTASEGCLLLAGNPPPAGLLRELPQLIHLAGY